ncbi:dTDP-glucose 4,6-dehydratase [Coraliomargarita akajimensis]|uniref:dTDP-glucose 4,6-dehydratase n=1 Tax=Coraliomargarita akajimensis (strain DSM 45221 / IAM 15411 / JCM 23193 / KCTC 12865 / 04OKA010-24) TaxID=583355 RepID=D5EP60_CORAD|nr:dTDP-glucose 4,6-dehydratase [Coraliomargarita akajimensis]ADE55570.1 dTDP-glucose 4,6-dehydratase [Coraliomargarita akajimensis DSM 45221]
MRIIVTGGAGFIGSALIRHLIQKSHHHVLNLDALTYASNTRSLAAVSQSDRYQFAQIDLGDRAALANCFQQYQPDTVIHLAAESHVDRSIDSPDQFIATNVSGTLNLLRVAQDYWSTLSAAAQDQFRINHVSTDEVYGDLNDSPEAAFSESSPYRPSSPYSASKAAADHLIHAWTRTYGLPSSIAVCCNNYGPYQFPEKLIPHMILRALNGQSLTIYGDGHQSREWLHVNDCAAALTAVLESGKANQRYNIGSGQQIHNLELVRRLCDHLSKSPHARLVGSNLHSLIEFVSDRPGHDRAYALDSRKIQAELNWKPEVSFDQGLNLTIEWYLANPDWWKPILEHSYNLQRQGRTQ